MGLRYWKRMRAQASEHADAVPPPGPNPWREPDTTLDDLGRVPFVSDTERAERTSEWAERLRSRRRPGRPTGEPAPEPTSTAGYWSCESLFEDSRRLAQEEARPNPWRVRELLAVFDLGVDATPAEIGSAYRRLAKQHHPDRFVSAEPEVQEFHAAHMRRIIDAYQELRQLQGV